MSNIKINQLGNKPPKLQKALKSRHITMISLGGTIGTGLFLASGGAIAQAGPGGALLAYALIGIMVYFLMTSLGEMAAYMPTSGSFSTYASKFVDPALGFALGWNYWYNWAITIAAEIAAVSLIMKYWFPNSSSAIWTVLFIVIVLSFNLLSVKSYGESEYWFAMIKVATVIVFIIISFLMIFGILGGQAPVGFTNFFINDGPFHGGFLATFGIFLAAGFSFQGTELLGVTAGETDNPGKNIPRAVKSVFWRIILFYILAIAAIGLLIPFTDERLLSEDIAVSPFTLVFDRLGIAVAASLMNAIILTAMLSAGNSGLYAASRMLWQLAVEGKAPKFFMKLSRRGIPIYALIATLAVGSLAFLASFFGDGVVYIWLLNASGMSGFIAWLGIAYSHYRFRRAFVVQGRDLSILPYKANWYPFGPLFALTVCLIVVLGQNYTAFMGNEIDWYGILVSYIGIPLFVLLWAGYKIKYKTKLLRLDECDLKVEK
ncbi:amino acid permease [Metasolibacillus meyeri]|uniref:Amino acid permease n=1 Tax=Metasolibacillus meyeri TaxID=1071052 RepID=A0AAW9NXF1_9BACL|nr:amino acid permease [Metasolibacillus meyeri]MEC1180815.1 amino acid permease [Metasolibacillus meyeri]